MTAELSMTVIRMTIFIAPQSPLSRYETVARDLIPVLFPNDLYVSQSEPFKLHRLCAISHTKILSASAWPAGPRVNGSSSHVCEMGVLI
jgi:hypothetical protein